MLIVIVKKTVVAACGMGRWHKGVESHVVDKVEFFCGADKRGKDIFLIENQYSFKNVICDLLRMYHTLNVEKNTDNI